MFGYIRPYVPDLRVREHELYRAIYCGLCRAMGKHTGCVSRLTLSYDFVFLAAVRTVLENVQYTAAPCRCVAHPLRRRVAVADNAALSYAARGAALLTEAKIADDIADNTGVSRLRARLLHPAAKRMVRRAFPGEEAADLRGAVTEALGRLHKLERGKSPSLDDAADCFGDLLSNLFAYGLSGGAASIAAAIGKSVGRFIYVLDAADDRTADAASGSYNPLNLAPIAPADLSVAVRLELSRLEAAVNLMEFTGYGELHGLIKNIIYEGMPMAADRIFSPEESKEGSGSIQ